MSGGFTPTGQPPPPNDRSNVVTVEPGQDATAIKQGIRGRAEQRGFVGPGGGPVGGAAQSGTLLSPLGWAGVGAGVGAVGVAVLGIKLPWWLAAAGGGAAGYALATVLED